MPVDTVFLVAVVGREVEAAAEPPRCLGRGLRSWGLRFRSGGEKADVGVAGGDVGIARVNHEGNAEGFPRLAGEFGSVRGGRRRERGAADVREADAGFFEDGAVGEDAGAPAAAFGARPIIGAKFRGAVHLFERGAEVGLQA